MKQPVVLVLAAIVFGSVLGPAVAGDDGVVPHVPPPVLPDAVRVHQEVRKVVEGLDARLLEVDVKLRRARLRVSTSEPRVLDEVRGRLEENAYLSTRARDAKRLVELSAIVRRESRWEQEFQLRFAEGAGEPAPPKAAHTILMPYVEEAMTHAGLALTYASRQRIDPNRKEAYERVSQRYHFDSAQPVPAPLTLERLEQLLAYVQASDTYRVTELAWRRLEPTEEMPDPGEAIQRPEIEISVWSPLDR